MPIELDKNLLDAKILNEIKLKTLDYSISNIDHADIELSLNQRIENVDLSISAVGKSNNYNDLDNLPNLTTKIENIDVQNGSGTTQFTTDGNDLKFNTNTFFLDTLTKTISVQSIGTFYAVALVSTTGNDLTARVGDFTKPFQTINNALLSTATIFIIAPGTYTYSSTNTIVSKVFYLNNTTLNLTTATVTGCSFIGFLSSNIVTLNSSNFIPKASNVTFNTVVTTTPKTALDTVDFENCIFNKGITLSGGTFNNCVIRVDFRNNSSPNGIFNNCTFENITANQWLNNVVLNRFNKYKYCRFSNSNFQINVFASSVLGRLEFDNCEFLNTTFKKTEAIFDRSIILTIKDCKVQGTQSLFIAGITNILIINKLQKINNISNVPLIQANPNITITTSIGEPEIVDVNFELIN